MSTPAATARLAESGSLSKTNITADEIEAAIEELRDVRLWRYGGLEPPWLQPIWIPARELAIWRRKQEQSAAAHNRPAVNHS